MQIFLFFRFTFKNGGFLGILAHKNFFVQAPKHILCQLNTLFYHKNDSLSAIFTIYSRHLIKIYLYIDFTKSCVIPGYYELYPILS